MPEQISLSKRQAAQSLSISLRTLDKLILAGVLPVTGSAAEYSYPELQLSASQQRARNESGIIPS